MLRNNNKFPRRKLTQQMKIRGAPKEVNVIAQMAEEIIQGNLNEVNLYCPYCGSWMIFSFTKNRPGRFGLFIFCENCGRLSHFGLSAMPVNFRDELVLEKFQKLEDEAMAKSKASP